MTCRKQILLGKTAKGNDLFLQINRNENVYLFRTNNLVPFNASASFHSYYKDHDEINNSKDERKTMKNNLGQV
jgi:hypothetical protein